MNYSVVEIIRIIAISLAFTIGVFLLDTIKGKIFGFKGPSLQNWKLFFAAFIIFSLILSYKYYRQIENDGENTIFINDFLIPVSGNILLGTSEGVVSYNLQTDTFYLSLRDKYITSLSICNHKIYAGSDQGVFVFDEENQIWKKTSFNDEIIDAWGVALMCDKEILYAGTSRNLFYQLRFDSVWYEINNTKSVRLFSFTQDTISYFATYGGKIYSINTRKMSVVESIDFGKKDGFLNSICYQKNRLFVGTDNGKIFRLNIGNFSKKEEIMNMEFCAIIDKVSDYSLIVATADTIIRTDDGGQNWQPILTVETGKKIPKIVELDSCYYILSTAGVLINSRDLIKWQIKQLDLRPYKIW